MKLLLKIHLKIEYYKNRVRIKKLKYLGARIGKGSRSYGRFSVVNIPNLIIGNNTTINEGVHINCRSKVNIGNDVHISTNVQIHSGRLDIDKNKRIHTQAKVTIGDNVWLAANVIVLAGVEIGKNTVVAAGSIVTKDIPSDCLVMGVPAKIMKYI
tara:strand:+ start:2588 stop:3052 length:465 start_codon:yes stop_codon:yes gene_type:complete